MAENERAALIERMAPLVLEDRRNVTDRKTTQAPWYFININHPAMRPFYEAWIHARETRIPPGDIERTQFELSLLTNKALAFMAKEYKKEGRL